MVILRKSSPNFLKFQPSFKMKTYDHLTSIGLILIQIILLMLSQPIVAKTTNTLSIYAPTNIRALSVKNLLLIHCPDLDIQVYSRIRDLQKKMKETQPDFILSEPPVIKTLENFKHFSQGVKNNSTTQEYLLVSQNNAFEINDIPNIKLGVLGILPRTPMEDYMKAILGFKTKIKRVAKTEDLAFLLNYKLVDALFISERVFSELRKTTQAELKTTYTGIQVGHVIIAVRNSATAPMIEKCITEFDSDLLTLFGVDKWNTN